MNMQPMSYIEVLQDWEVFLKNHPNNFLRIRDLGANRWLTFDNTDNPTYLKWETVLVSGCDALSDFFDGLIKDRGISQIYVQFKRTNGSSSVHSKTRQAKKFDLGPRKDILKNTAQPKEVQQPHRVESTIEPAPQYPQHQPRAQHAPYGQNGFESQVMQHMGGLGAAGMAAGLGYRELVTMEKKAEMSDHYKGEMDRYKKENDILVIENRSLQTKVDNAVKEKELAVQETKLAARSWADPENINSLLKHMGPVAQTILSRGQVNGPQQLGMGAGEELSEPKKRFVGYVCDPDFEDDTVIILENVLVTMHNKPDFRQKLIEILQKELNDAAVGS